MGRSKETFHKKEVQKRKEKKRQDKEKKKMAKRESESEGGPDSMIAYVDEFGRITDKPPEQERTKVKAKDIEIGVPKKEDLPEEETERRGVVSFFNESIRALVSPSVELRMAKSLTIASDGRKFRCVSSLTAPGSGAAAKYAIVN